MKTYKNFDLLYNQNMKCYFFGTYNPIHLGHIEIAQQVKKLCNFDKIIFVPAYMPPHKIDNLAPYVERLNMVKLAAGEDNVSDIEKQLKIPSYTYRTIEKLYEENNNEKINFIIGYDQFFQIESWKEPDILKEKIHFVVVPRRFQNGQTLSVKALEYFKNKGFDFELVNIDFLDISASDIRKCLSKNESIAGLVSREVREYIENNGIYRNLVIEKTVEKKI